MANQERVSMSQTTYTIDYPFGHQVEIKSKELADRARAIGLEVTEQKAGYRRV